MARDAATCIAIPAYGHASAPFFSRTTPYHVDDTGYNATSLHRCNCSSTSNNTAPLHLLSRLHSSGSKSSTIDNERNGPAKQSRGRSTGCVWRLLYLYMYLYNVHGREARFLNKVRPLLRSFRAMEEPLPFFCFLSSGITLSSGECAVSSHAIINFLVSSPAHPSWTAIKQRKCYPCYSLTPSVESNHCRFSILVMASNF